MKTWSDGQSLARDVIRLFNQLLEHDLTREQLTEEVHKLCTKSYTVKKRKTDE